jgi:hypothetical protein
VKWYGKGEMGNMATGRRKGKQDIELVVFVMEVAASQT